MNATLRKDARDGALFGLQIALFGLALYAVLRVFVPLAAQSLFLFHFMPAMFLIGLARAVLGLPGEWNLWESSLLGWAGFVAFLVLGWVAIGTLIGLAFGKLNRCMSPEMFPVSDRSKHDGERPRS